LGYRSQGSSGSNLPHARTPISNSSRAGTRRSETAWGIRKHTRRKSREQEWCNGLTTGGGCLRERPLLIPTRPHTMHACTLRTPTEAMSEQGRRERSCALYTECTNGDRGCCREESYMYARWPTGEPCRNRNPASCADEIPGRLIEREPEGWGGGRVSVLGGKAVVRFPDELHSMWGSILGSSHSLHAPQITPRPPVHTHKAC